MKRYNNRFPYFALRYFDESNLLDGISFHVHLGKWIKSMHEKKIIIERDRVILRNVRAFGEPYKFNNDFFPENWDIDQFEQYAPAYRFAGNRIGITLKKGLRNKWPKLTRNTKPDAIISTYELPNLFVYAYLHKQEDIEVPPTDYIQTYIDNINNCISDVQQKKLLPAGKFTLEKNRNQKENLQLNKRKAFNGEKKHPFLNRINISEQKGIYDFYKAYFSEKEQWLDKIISWFNSKSFSEEELFSQNDYLIINVYSDLTKTIKNE